MLEAFPLDTLKMVGTIGRGAGLVAVITAPGQSHLSGASRDVYWTERWASYEGE